MTIRFNCPTCNALIAFHDKHCGKRARCLTCGQLFIIPAKDHEKPQKVEALSEEEKVPIAGFYRSVFMDSWKMFIKPQNATGLVFVVAAVCFKFFLGHTDYSWTLGGFRFQAPLGLIVTLAAWGCLFWYYMEIIYSAAFDVEELPDVYMGGLFGFIWNVIRSLCIFAVALVVVQLPCIIFLVVSRKVGIEPQLVEVISHILAIAGLFAFPMAILTFSVGRDITMAFRPDYILKPIVNAFWPYFVVIGFFVLVWEIQLATVGYDQLQGKGTLVIGLHLLASIVVQALALVSMRSIGLFHRHYSCHFHW
jgi:hypothetical protein